MGHLRRNRSRAYFTPLSTLCQTLLDNSDKAATLTGEEPRFKLDYRYLSCRGRTWFRRVAGTLKIKLQQPETVASFLWLVTGGGKLITNHETAMVRLTGGEDQPKEDDLRKQERYRTSSSSDTGSDNLATLCLLSACAMPKVGHSCVARNNRPNQQITVK